MKPRTSISSTAAIASSKLCSNNTFGGSSINSVFSPIGPTTGPVKEGLVSQIASRFQQQVGVANTAESEIEKLSAKRKISEPVKSVHKHNTSNVPSLSSENLGFISNSGDSLIRTPFKENQQQATSPRKLSAARADHVTSSNRTDSHQARFHNARAMFEKMGSADDLDSIPASPTVNIPPSYSGSGKPLRALSVGSKPTVPEHFLNNKFNSNASSITSSYNSNLGVRSRSTSPFGGSRSSSQSSIKHSTYNSTTDPSGIVRSSSGSFMAHNSNTSLPAQSSNGNMAITTVSDVSNELKSINGHTSKNLHNDENDNRSKENIEIVDKSDIQNDNARSKMMDTKSRKTSDYKSPFNLTNNEEGSGHKNSTSSIGRPNIKELTNKQRNWFSNFERGKTSTSASTSGTVTPENVESSRRTSVKQDNIPNLLSGLDRIGSKVDISTKSSVPDATPTPSSNLNQPGDRRPLNMSSCSSDSIEDYIRNWKGEVNPESLVPQVGSPTSNGGESRSSSVNVTPQSSGPSSLNSDSKYGYSKSGTKLYNRMAGSKDSTPRSGDKSPRPPVLSPKPNPDVVKRFSFNKNKQGESNSLNSPSLEEVAKPSGILQSKYDNTIPSSSLKQNNSKQVNDFQSSSESGAVSWRKNGISSNKKTDTSKITDGKVTSGSVVRKLSAEYNNKIQDDLALPKSNVFSSSNKKHATTAEGYLHNQPNQYTEKKPSVAPNTSNSSNNILSAQLNVIPNSASHTLNNSEPINSDKRNINGLAENKETTIPPKYDGNFGSKEKECKHLDEKLDKLSGASNCNEFDGSDIVNAGINIKTEEDKNAKISNVFPKHLGTTSAMSHCNAIQDTRLNLSNLNQVNETVPFIDANNSNLTSSPKVTPSQEIRGSSSKPNKLDLQLQKIYRPKSTENSDVSLIQSEDSSIPIATKESTSKLGSPSYLDNEEITSLNTSNINSPNITGSCSVDTVLEKKSDNDQEMSGDEFQDEIHFDPTISSGHLGYDKEGDFRNTPITVGGARDAIITPSQMDASYVQNQTTPKSRLEGQSKKSPQDEKLEDESLPLVMSPKEEENLLSNKIVERRGVLSDEQAEEVKALLTPDKDLPPIPSNEVGQDSTGQSNIKTSKSDSNKTPNESYDHVPNKSNSVSSAINKLDSLVYSGPSGEFSCNGKVGQEKSGKSSDAGKIEKTSESETLYERPKQHEETYFDEQAKVHYYDDGHYWFEIAGLDSTENANLSPSERLPPGCYKKPGKLRFSTNPMKQYSTYAVDDYDRRNDDVDPVAASGIKKYLVKNNGCFLSHKF